ncbi:MAG: polysaccharide biosynthesis/export family protein [Verrucomicrobiota bacterium]
MMQYVHRISMPSLVRHLLGIACLLFLAGCATGGSAGSSTHPGAAQTAPGDRPLESVDALRVGEMLVIEFSGVGEPPARHEERIKIDGKITLPSIGTIQAAGRTRGELEDAIHKAYVPAYYRQLTVIVRNEGRFFYVNGQVKSPGQFPYIKEMTVLKAIAVAGDFTDFANKKQVLVTRGADGRKITVNCIKAQRDHTQDLYVYPDDTIEVKRRYF